MLSKQALEEFKKIWREEKGEDISDAEATDEAINLLTMMNAIYRPIKKEWVEELERKDAEQAKKTPYKGDDILA